MPRKLNETGPAKAQTAAPPKSGSSWSVKDNYIYIGALAGVVLLILIGLVTYAWSYEPYRGRIDVIWLPHQQVLERCGYQGRPSVRGCTFGGVKSFGGVRGRCVIVLDETRPHYLEHEKAHCAGWEHH